MRPCDSPGSKRQGVTPFGPFEVRLRTSSNRASYQSSSLTDFSHQKSGMASSSRSRTL